MKFRNYFTAVLACTALSTGIVSGCGGSSGGGSSPAANNGNEGENNEPGNTDNGGIPAAVDFGVDTTDTGSNPLMYVNGNNNARLTGPVFGSGELDNSAVVKKLDLYGPSGSDSALLAVDVYAGFGTYSYDVDSRLFNNTTLFFAIQNVSQQLQCGQILDFKVVLTDGTLWGRFANSTQRFNITAEGSAYQSTDINGYPSFDDDCIPPGSIVYAHEDANVSFSDPGPELEQVAGITGGYSFAAPGAAEPAEPIVPLSYTVDDSGDISVLVENQDGLQGYEISMDAYALNDQGWPIFYFFGSGEVVLQPGESGTLTLRGNRFKGSASALRVLIKAEHCGTDAGYLPDC